VFYLKASVGIEIKGEDLLISCLKKNFGGGVFTKYARIAGYCQREPEQVRSEMDGFFKTEKVSRDNIVLGIPRKDVILRYLDLPKEVEDNLKQVMAYQVQSFEPTEDEKLYYDFALVKNEKADKKLQVLAVMVRKSSLDAHLKVLNRLGVRPSIVTAGTLALANMLLGTLDGSKDKTFLLADLKHDGIEIAVLRGGAFVYGREADRPGDCSAKQLLMNEMEVAVGKVRLDPEENIEGIVLAGEESETALDELKESMPGCELLGSRLRFQMSPQNRSQLKEAINSLGLAYVGITRSLSMKLNLLPGDLRLRQKRWAYIPTIIFGLALVLILAGFGFRQTIQQKILIGKLDQEIKTLDASANRIRKLRAEATELEKRVASIEEVLTKRDQNLEILRALTGLLPSDTYLSLFKNQDCTMTMQGQSPPASSSDLISKIELSPLLKDVVTTQATFRNMQTGKDIFSLSAKCEK
jgi:Tfp pilus assembly PilM family ATPase/Tfp pilus assembly protein PilN